MIPGELVRDVVDVVGRDALVEWLIDEGVLVPAGATEVRSSYDADDGDRFEYVRNVPVYRIGDDS